ncbi:hypothetical protein [Mangrovibacterium diazotrophicum]|uniref:BNR repeat protein n=1 Tax=Mangrovibacterium diazotrophicum TaxID=1261403 RepID=A0A419W4H6_9BACT|nr:hypothetical protein [Mangrovibacterium diazotrophicum]RKD90363.1 hypothetical protein BC643_0700 [Mangrovibacterium diazotrophicum]
MRIFCVMVGLLLAGQMLFGQEAVIKDLDKTSYPVFQVDYANPTADKPQSKLWYLDQCWWAIIPKSNGPSLWERTSSGWIENTNVNETLEGVPGRADVYLDGNQVTAVGVDTSYLGIFRLEREGQTWKAQKLASLFPSDAGSTIETATIVKDLRGKWWVSAIAGSEVCVWNSEDGGRKWSKPLVLARGIGKDDICTITEVPGGVAVIWSDQLREAVKFRSHLTGEPAHKWEKETIIEQGNKTADDHLNTALSADGTLWMTTKNSVDVVGKPQFVLRVRTPEGKWSNYPYCNLGNVEQPSRPIILTVEDNPSLILNGYTIYNSKSRYLGVIDFGIVDTTKTEIISQVTPVMVPDTTDWLGKNQINNVTGSKRALPKGAPWIVLASDNDGRIYEVDLAGYFGEKLKE